MQRRELFGSLGSLFKEKEESEVVESIIRPPYFNDDADFHKSCSSCEAKSCATVCEEQIIVIREDGTPELSFAKSGCTFCDECAIACESDALHVSFKKHTIDADVIINQASCMSWHSTMCFTCKDPCLENAIDFQAMFKPTINMDLCTSCGFCISRCPVVAIEVS